MINAIYSYTPHLLLQIIHKTHKIANFALRQRISYGKPHYINTVKELDTETGLYYYGARYLDPKISRWISGDPAVSEYIPSAPVSEEARKRNGNLPGMGGVFNYVNLHVYHYAGNNPVKLVDPDGRNMDEETFGNMSAEAQLEYLKGQVQLGYFLRGQGRGDIAANLRSLRGSMKLSELFNLAKTFMNVGLRNFLNLNTDGTMNYRFDDMFAEGSEWIEMSSIDSMYHQTEADSYLNAKFVHPDGREVVFNRGKNLINTYPDKGTFNYVNANDSSIRHYLYDVNPYTDYMGEMNIKTVTRNYPISEGGNSRGNSSYWPPVR